MKNKTVSLITLFVTSCLLAACGGKTVSSQTSNNPQGSTSSESSAYNYEGAESNPNDSSSSDTSSSSSSDSSQHTANESELDKAIAQFLEGVDVTVPSLADYDLSYSVLYYYAYEQYIISAEGEDAEYTIEEEYAAKFTADTNFVSGNDEYTTIEDEGYYFVDESNNVVINFFTVLGEFYFTICRSDGSTGSLDVSNVDTSWYVDYINFYDYDLVDAFPANDIKEQLGITANIVIPSIDAPKYPAIFAEAYYNGSSYQPDSFTVVLEGDQVEDYADILDKAGYDVTLIENEGYDIDWESFEMIEYTYYTATASDASKNIFIDVSFDESGNTAITFYNFNDVFTNVKTPNTDWEEDDKALMNSTLHQVLPFMQFGEDYYLYDASDEDYDYLVLYDTYSEDLSSGYIALLVENGFKEDSSTYYSTCYYYDNGIVYIEIFVDYDLGNYLEIYFENTHLPALTAFALNEESVDVVAGAAFELKAIYTPADAAYPISWSSNNDAVATVDNKGLVTIKNDAAVDATAVITASAGNKTASCTFTVKENTVTGIVFNQDNYGVVAGGEKVQTAYFLLPYGATSNAEVTYSVNPNNVGINCDNNGQVWADDSAELNATATITVSINGTYSDSATIKVVPATVTHTLTSSFFNIPDKKSEYDTYKKTTADGASYEAQAASTHGLQIRSKNSTSGVIGHFEGKSCQSMTFTIDSNTYSDRTIDIYASNTPFSIKNMYDSSDNKVASLTYSSSDASTSTLTYTFTENYSYIGFRSNDGAIYLTSVEIIWK